MSAFDTRDTWPRRARQAVRRLLTALLTWCGENYGIDPVYLGVLLAASFELWIQRMAGIAGTAK